jgi:hypothetical protein
MSILFLQEKGVFSLFHKKKKGGEKQLCNGKTKGTQSTENRNGIGKKCLTKQDGYGIL